MDLDRRIFLEKDLERTLSSGRLVFVDANRELSGGWSQRGEGQKWPYSSSEGSSERRVGGYGYRLKFLPFVRLRSLKVSLLRLVFLTFGSFDT